MKLTNLYSAYISIGLLIGAGVAFAQISGLIDTPAIGEMLIYGMAIMMVPSILYSIFWWREVDEAVKEAHKSAWFWGGSSGISMGFIGLAINRYFMLHLDVWFSKTFYLEHAPFEAGFLMALFMMTIGYGIAWVYWWMKRR
jgi:hypothetical protein